MRLLLAALVLWIPACSIVAIIRASRHRMPRKSRPAAKLPAEGGRQADRTERILTFLDGDRGPVVWDTRKLPHLAIAGVTGHGKTACLRSLIRAAIHGRWQIFIADAKGFEFIGFTGHPGVERIATDGPEIERMMRDVWDELDRRKKTMKRLLLTGLSEAEAFAKAAHRPWLIVVDECTEMAEVTGGVGKSEAVANLGSLARMGRALDLHLVPATQQFNAKEALPTSVRRQCDAQLALGRVGLNGLRTLEWSKEQDIAPPDADPGVGSFVCGSGGRARLVRARYADPPRAIAAEPSKPQPVKPNPGFQPTTGKVWSDVHPPPPVLTSGVASPFRSGRTPT